MSQARNKRLAALERQLARLDRRLGSLQALSDRYVRLRVAIVASGGVVSFLAFSQVSDAAGYAGIGLTLLIFGIAAYFHRQVQASISQHHYWHLIKARHLARMRLEWAKLPPSSASAPPAHPFAHDLDIVGEHSLHRLLNTAASREGAARLTDWLLAGEADLSEIEGRQKLVGELTWLSSFRDRLTLRAWLAAGGPDHALEGDEVLAWFERPTQAGPTRFDLILLVGLALLNITLFVGQAYGLPRIWPLSFLVYAAHSLWKLNSLGDLFQETLALRSGMQHLAAVFAYLEKYAYASVPQTKALCAPLWEQRPSQQMRRIGQVLAGTSLRGNAVLWTVVNVVMPWDMLMAALLMRQKGTLAAQMPRWLAVWYELEALNALANFAYLNPDYELPRLHESGGFQARALGHPLIPYESRVCNNFSLEEMGSFVLITGSNMSGKSSFLRTIGVTLVLAYAGGPVNADSFECGLFRVFSTIRINDSLSEGFSYFYAEVRRLKALLDALQADHSLPLFFLIDEIFKGTNNRERLIGSQAYLRALAGGHGMGVVTTHDLELVQLADEISQMENTHFREEVVDGQMRFDYQLRPGPSPTTNALKIMQLEGLPVSVAGGDAVLPKSGIWLQSE